MLFHTLRPMTLADDILIHQVTSAMPRGGRMSALYCLVLLPNKTMHESVKHDDSFCPGSEDCDNSWRPNLSLLSFACVFATRLT